MKDSHNIEDLSSNRQVLRISRLVFQAAFPFFGGLRVSGDENVAGSGPLLLCPNHTSDLDPVAVLAATKRDDINALGKDELFEIPFLGAYFRAVGAIPVKRDSPDLAALRIAEKILKLGRMLLVFPEGRSSESGKLLTVQPGAALLSQRTGAPIVPVGIRGTRNLLPYSDLIPKFAAGGVSVTFGSPIDPCRYRHLPHREAVNAMVHDLRAELAKLTRQS